MKPRHYREMSAIGLEHTPRMDLNFGRGRPPEGGPAPIHPAEPQLTSPIGPDGIDAGLSNDIASRMFGKAATKR